MRVEGEEIECFRDEGIYFVPFSLTLNVLRVLSTVLAV